VLETEETVEEIKWKEEFVLPNDKLFAVAVSKEEASWSVVPKAGTENSNDESRSPKDAAAGK